MIVSMIEECISLEQDRRQILPYHLQWFAKDGPGGEKTEPATAKS